MSMSTKKKKKKDDRKSKGFWYFLMPVHWLWPLRSWWKLILLFLLIPFLATLFFVFQFLFRSVCSDVLSDIVVFAKVPGPTPTQPATIVVPTNGQVFEVQNIGVSGTCQTNTIVIITRNSINAGSSACTMGGTFAQTIDLVVGDNELVARTVDFFDQFGPDSAPVTVNRLVPVTPPTPVTPSSSPTTPSPQVVGPFIITSTANAVRVGLKVDITYPITIIGGTAPYNLRISWGDGKKETLTPTASGDLTLHHKYSRSGTYILNIEGTDAVGRPASYKALIVIATTNISLPPAAPVIRAGCTRAVDSITPFRMRTYMWIPLLLFGIFLATQLTAGIRRLRR